MCRILTCGSATTDLFLDVEVGTVRVESGGYETDLISFESGSKMQVRELNTRVGGGGVNTAVDLSRLGNDVKYLGKLGDDKNAADIMKTLKEENVEVVDTKKSKHDTGFSIIIKSDDGDRVILAYKGANNDLRWKDFNKNNLRGVDWYYFASMVGESYRTMKKLGEWAVDKGKDIVFNPSSYVVRRGMDHIRKVMRLSTVFMVNMEEAQILLGRRPNDAQLPEAEVDHILKALHRVGPDLIVVTNGDNNTYVFDGKHKYTARPYPVEVVNVVGAGDAFGSGFVSAYCGDRDVEHAMETGFACAHSVVSSPETWVQLRGLKAAETISRQYRGKGHKVIRQRIV